jgi:4-amino-4-deoxy-L-arabinose transferase-like glycosyltransferase
VYLVVPGVLALASSLMAIRLNLGPGASIGGAWEYLGAAHSLLAGHGIPRAASPLWGFHPPLYSLFIASIWKVFGVHIGAIFAAQAVLFALTAVLLAQITMMVTGQASLALLAGVLFAFDPLALSQVNTIEAEPIEMLLLVLAVFLVLRGVMKGGPGSHPLRELAVAGVVLGLATLARDVAAFIAVALAVALWWLLRRHLARIRWGAPVAMLSAACLVIAPWTVLNWRATGDYIPVSTLGGFNLWLGNNPAALRALRGSFPSEAAVQEYNQFLQSTLPTRQMRAWGPRYLAATIGDRQGYWLNAALREMEHHPLTTAKLWAYKTWEFWRPWLQPLAYSHLEVMGSQLVEVPLYAFALVGLVALVRRPSGRPFLALIGAVALASTLVSTVSNSTVRYRIPTVDPYLYVLGAIGLATTALWLRSRQRDPVPP